jgi:hypothetical protein
MTSMHPSVAGVRSTIESVARHSTRLLVGSTPEEIAAVEASLGRSFPGAYRAFLECAGKSAGDLLDGSDYATSSLPEMRVAAERLLAEQGSPPLRRGDLVFCAHQGYQFLYMAAEPGLADPAVFYSLEGEKPREVSPSFTRWLAKTVEEELPFGT